MTCLEARLLSGAGMKLHSSMLGTFFVYTYIHLGTMYANFQEKIFAGISGKQIQTLHCSNVTTMKSLELFPRNLPRRFFLENWHTPPTQKYETLSLTHPELVYQASHRCALLIGWLNFCSRVYVSP